MTIRQYYKTHQDTIEIIKAEIGVVLLSLVAVFGVVKGWWTLG